MKKIYLNFYEKKFVKAVIHDLLHHFLNDIFQMHLKTDHVNKKNDEK